MTNYFVENVQALLKKAVMTPNALSERLGVDSATVYRWLDPKFQSLPRSRTLVLLAEFFGVEPNKLVTERLDLNDVDKPSSNTSVNKKRTYRGSRIPLVTADNTLLLAGLLSDDIENVNSELWPGAKEWLPAAPDLDLPQERLVAIRVTGSAMAPIIQNGDLVYVDFIFGGDMESPDIKEGDIVLAEPSGPGKPMTNAPVVRKLVYGDNEQDRWLTATNPDFPGTRTVKANDILGKVVSIYRKLPS